MITVFRWDSVSRECGLVDQDELPATSADLPAEDVWWIDLTDPTPEEEAKVLGSFHKVHALTLEDITKPRREPEQGSHLPKAEEFADYLLIIVNPLPPGLAAAARKPPPSAGAPPADALQTLHTRRDGRPQLSAILTRTVLITHHYQRVGCVAQVRAYLERHCQTARRGPDFLFHLILDGMVDEYAPVVDRISDRLNGLETRLFRDPSPKVLSRILRLKRMVVGLRKTLILEREVLARLIRGEFELVEEREVHYYRNVFDHLVRYTELIEAAREMVSDLMQTHLSAASNKLNQILKVLTMISTVVLPMSLIAGIYGMNFEENVWPDYKTARWGFPFVIGLMGLTGAASFALFRWRKWL